MSEKVTNVQIEDSWKTVLADEFQQPYFAVIKDFLVQERQAGKTVFPPGPLIFNAFNQTSFDAVKVVLIGQDPYHNPGEAMGLSFSVPRRGTHSAFAGQYLSRIAQRCGRTNSHTWRPHQVGATRCVTSQRHPHGRGQTSCFPPKNWLADLYGCGYPASV